ncbi:hypothetical protein MSIM_47770 [Mycobacterium simiae]|nr:hypothetical protein MSIM_47770 [Mycobacterium simiae]
MNERQRRVQPEASPFTRDKPNAFAALLAQRDCRDAATAFHRHRVTVGMFTHGRYFAVQNVPMLENSQYQNQMMSPVPPHAAT